MPPAACCPNPTGFLLDDMKDFNARVFRLLAKEMKVEDLSVPKEEPGELLGLAAENGNVRLEESWTTAALNERGGWCCAANCFTWALGMQGPCKALARLCLARMLHSSLQLVQLMTALSNLCPAALPAAADEADEAEEAADEGAEKEQDVKVSGTQYTACACARSHSTQNQEGRLCCVAGWAAGAAGAPVALFLPHVLSHAHRPFSVHTPAADQVGGRRQRCIED